MKSQNLEIRKVEWVINGTRIIKNLSIKIQESRVGIIGRNGSGKSTLARLMAGLIKPTRGYVIIDEINVATNRKEAIKNVGMVFQNPDHQIIFPTVIEELSFGLETIEGSKKIAQGKAREILKLFGKSDWEDRLVQELSQGQKHLLCLLSVLAMRPKIIILDEPFTGPDLLTVSLLNKFISTLPQSIVLISHDTKSMESFERVIWMDEGTVKMDGSPSEVLKAFENEMNRLVTLDVNFKLSDKNPLSSNSSGV